MYLLLVLAGCAPVETELRLGASPWPGNAPLIHAADAGRLGAGVRVVEFASESATLQAFRNLALEAAILTLDEALLLAAEGQRLRVVALNDISLGAGRIMARPAIKNLTNLRGRRVAVESAAVGAFFLEHALRQAGLTSADIELVALLPHEQAREYAAGGIDAAVGHEPFSSRLEKLGAHAVFDTRQIDGDIVRALVVRDDASAIAPPRLARLAAALFAAQADFAPADAAIARQAAKRYGQSAEEFARAWDGLRLLGEQENHDYFADDAGRLRELLAHIRDEMLAADLIPRPPHHLVFGLPR
jgi:NitT/TauT family transport system substrate-binding protein